MKKGTFGNLYSPYQKAENDTMDDWYIEYLNDTARIICIDGKVFSKIIHRCEFYLKPGFCLLVVFEPQEQIFLGDVLIDEEGNQFSVAGFEMFRFTGNIPEWNSQFVTVSIIGENYCIGNYLRRKGADSNDGTGE